MTALPATVTLVFTDLVDSTALKSALPGADLRARNQAYFDRILEPHRRRIEAELPRYGGRLVETIYLNAEDGRGCRRFDRHAQVRRELERRERGQLRPVFA